MPETTVLLVTAETFGRGDDALGATLMSVFLDTLGEVGDRLTHAVFVNGGANLTVPGSPVLAQLEQLASLGVELLTCGTCLEHYGIAAQPAVGTRSNMAEIVETLTAAGRIIQP